MKIGGVLAMRGNTASITIHNSYRKVNIQCIIKVVLGVGSIVVKYFRNVDKEPKLSSSNGLPL